ncbi:hypothetical protein [Mucilaginibacter panaciglaebae]|uniref:Uncharacterized protein n=1 Tax=Mucilaginibacter panaciglaebae TaxID=502331 RepID=A0ABP7WBY5_9SPHI
MLIKIKNRKSGNTLKVQATEELINGLKIWRIVFPKNETIFIARLNGQWKSIGKLILSYDLLNEIGVKLNLIAIINRLRLRHLGE